MKLTLTKIRIQIKSGLNKSDIKILTKIDIFNPIFSGLNNSNNAKFESKSNSDNRKIKNITSEIKIRTKNFKFCKDKTMLELIKLDHNNFKFDFSNLDLPMGIRTLDISHNEIHGSLPKLLGQLPLESINVSYNNLCGMIPTGGWLKQFSRESFAHNKCLCC